MSYSTVELSINGSPYVLVSEVTENEHGGSDHVAVIDPQMGDTIEVRTTVRPAADEIVRVTVSTTPKGSVDALPVDDPDVDPPEDDMSKGTPPQDSHGTPVDGGAPKPPGSSPGETLIPGTGWSGPTPVPPPIGDPSDDYYDVKPSMRFHIPPYQTVATTQKIAIRAYHPTGMDRVEVAVDNGDWISVEDTAFDDDTGAYDYYVTLDASEFTSDGQVEIRARGYPIGPGTPRVLGASHTVAVNNRAGISALMMSVNDGGTLPTEEIYVAASGNDTTGNGTVGNPYATIDKAIAVIKLDIVTYDGCEIIVDEAGTYAITHTSGVGNHSRWITIRSGDAIANDDVIISNGSHTSGNMRPKIQRWCMRDMKLDHHGQTSVYKNDDQWLWLDNMHIVHTGAAGEGGGFRNNGGNGFYVTNCHWDYAWSGPGQPNLCRGTKIQGVLGFDCFNGHHGLVSMCTVNDVDTTSATHVDCYQMFDGGGTLDNLILADCKFSGLGLAQTYFADEALLMNSAVVNVIWMHDETPPSSEWQIELEVQGLFFAHCTHVESGILLRNDVNFSATNLLFQNCVLLGMTPGQTPTALPAGVKVDSCHFVNVQAWAGDPDESNTTNGAITAVPAGPWDEHDFTLGGAALAELTDSAAVIPGLITSDAVPDRGAWVATDTGNEE